MLHGKKKKRKKKHDMILPSGTIYIDSVYVKYIAVISDSTKKNEKKIYVLSGSCYL